MGCFHRYLVVIFFTFGVGCLFATTTQDFFVESVKFTTTCPFSAQRLLCLNGEAQAPHFCQNGMMRSELYTKGSRRYSYSICPISGTQGSIFWHEKEGKKGKPLKNTVVYSSVPSDEYIPFLLEQITPRRMTGAEYTVIMRNEEFLKLRVKYPQDKDYICRQKRMSFCENYLHVYKMEEFDEAFSKGDMTFKLYEQFQNDISKAYHAYIVFFITKVKNKPFIYGYEAYSSKGVLLRQIVFKELDFPDSLPEELFHEPKGVKKRIMVSSSKEYAQVFFNYFGSGFIDPTPSVAVRFFMKLWAGLKRGGVFFVDYLIEHGGTVFGIIGSVLICAIIVLKKISST